MKRDVNRFFVQCCSCGTIHEVCRCNGNYLEDELYYKVWCSECKDVSTQQYIGESEDDFILYSNPIWDQRYYY